jgi:tetratricopeptide (TPR) repeat protein
MGTLKRLGFLLFSSGLLYAPAWGQSREDAALMSALEAQSYAEVVQRTEQDLRIHPANPWLWTIRGMAFEGEGQTSAGLKCLEKALVINPRYIPALKAAGQIAYRRGDARARGYLDRLLALQPDTPTAHAMEGVLDFSAHRCTDAIAHFERSSALAESDVTSAEEFASCLLEQHRTTEAVNMLTEAYRLHPVKDLRYDLGLAALKDGQASLSLAVLASAPDDDDEMLNLRAAAKIATGNLSDAFASL